MELSAAGAVLEQGRQLSGIADCAISLAGPAAGMVAAGICVSVDMPMLAGANIMLSVFNCLPLLPLDGGCALSSLFCLLPTAIYVPAQQALAWFSFLASTVFAPYEPVFLAQFIQLWYDLVESYCNSVGLWRKDRGDGFCFLSAIMCCIRCMAQERLRRFVCDQMMG